MYLRRIELQGFKTFATKTVLEFSGQNKRARGITGIVGPNGSGKSNIADAIRWVMGEQSMKLLRGKKSEDVIFSGSEKKSRSGFAEVSMTLENDDKPELDMSEVVVTRRLYRDGKSEYEINRQAAKLNDVVLLLAQLGLGQRTYSVIGQGMVDAVLTAGPAERKEFFDEAAGLKPFQLKRHQSVNKLASAKDHLNQAEVVLGEIGPRLRTLERHVKRLEQKDEIEQELEALEREYFGGVWFEIFGQMTEAKTKFDRARSREETLAKEADALEGELKKLAKADAPSKEFEAFQTSLNDIAERRAKLREEEASLKAKLEIAKVKAERPEAPMPLSKIISSIEAIDRAIDDLLELVSKEKPDFSAIKKKVADLQKSQKDMLNRLQKPAPEPEAKLDPAIVKKLEGIAKNIQSLDEESRTLREQIDSWKKKEEGDRSHLFETQSALNEKRNEARAAEREAGDAAVQLARWETKSEQFMTELRTHRPDWEKSLNEMAQKIGKKVSQDELHPKISKLRTQLEWIGSIDPETLKDYEETKERHDFLLTQVEDLQGAIKGLETVIKELDETIQTRSEAAFSVLDGAFQQAFKTLFGGGEARLIQVAPEPTMDEEGNIIPPPKDAPVAGIDIQATPPGKRLKSIALLSGGERALTSIALISAIMATNPSPFIVLDEVDAALDESNSKKFADIITGHADRTQFIIITHNRATMNQAKELYGVTMGEDGSSQLLSVKLEDLVKKITA